MLLLLYLVEISYYGWLAHTHGERNLMLHYKDIMDGIHMAAASFGKYYLHNHFSLNNNVPILILGFPGGAVVKNLSANVRRARDTGSIPGFKS